MPHYEFFCRDCKKAFSKTLTIVRHEKEKIACPHCGSTNVEQRWSAFSVITSVQFDGRTCEHDVVIDCGRSTQAQEKAIHAIWQTVRPHAAVH